MIYALSIWQLGQTIESISCYFNSSMVFILKTWLHHDRVTVYLNFSYWGDLFIRSAMYGESVYSMSLRTAKFSTQVISVRSQRCSDLYKSKNICGKQSAMSTPIRRVPLGSGNQISSSLLGLSVRVFTGNFAFSQVCCDIPGAKKMMFSY